MSYETAQIVAARGAEFLDNEDPDWYKKVDRQTLRMSDCVQCVLGQLYGSYVAACRELDFVTGTAVSLGFDKLIGGYEDYWDYLNAAWINEISDRLASEDVT
jgi:hypothetical protein